MKRDHLYVKPCGCLSGVFGRSQTSREPWRITCRRFVATCSYCDEKSLEVILRHWKTVFFQSGNIALNSFTNICYSFFFRLPLADAAGQAGTFGYPVIIFARVEDDLSHFIHLIISCQSMIESIPLSSSDKQVLLSSSARSLGDFKLIFVIFIWRGWFLDLRTRKSRVVNKPK